MRLSAMNMQKNIQVWISCSKGEGELEILKLISEITKFKLRTPCLSERQANSELSTVFPYPAFDLYPQLNYICMATSRGVH